MFMASVIGSIVLTIFVLVLSLITIQKGYGFKHTIDPPEHKETSQVEQNHEQND